jgi:hypothetical protein
MGLPLISLVDSGLATTEIVKQDRTNLNAFKADNC